MLRNLSLKILFTLFFFFGCSSFSFALDIPSNPADRVNDYAHLLDASSKAELESKLQTFEQSTSNQLVVVTFPSLEGENLEDFSIRLAEKWKLGQKGKDNGVILLIFKNDRKLRIEVGYGLEGALPDATAKLIIQNEIVPYFKKGDFKGGIFSGVEAIISTTKGEYKSTTKKEEAGWFNFIIFILFMSVWGFVFIASMIYKTTRGIRGTTLGSRSSGSFWDSFGSGSGGGGGFSGGGGSFGGGGSSGSW